MSTVIKGSASGQINLNDTTGSIQLNGSDVLTIDSSGNLTAPNDVSVTGNVGIGTSSPTEPLSVSGISSLGVDQTDYIQIRGGGGTGRVETVGTNTNINLALSAKGAGGIYFWRNGYGGTESMRIDSDGVVRINNTANATFNAQLNIFSPSTRNCTIHSRTDTSGAQSHIIFGNATSDSVGSIQTSTSSTSYITSSDYRLKENVAPMSGSIDRLKQLKPSTWSWTQDGSHGEGFLAHEAQTVVPEAVTGTKDAMRTEEYEVTPAVTDDEGNVTTAAVMGTREVPDYQGIDQSKLVPLLTAALQEAITKIEDLETRIQALESA